MNKEQQSSYRQIMKATSLFGGVQVFQIIIQVIRSKFIAILLGPAGMGIAGLLNSTIELIGGFTNFGLGISAVKNVSAANATGNKTRVAIIIKVLKRLVWITGLLGTVVAIIFSYWLSQLTFGNTEYTLAFIWISITLLFKQLTTSNLVLLQGLRKIQFLAKANLLGSFLGLIITVPLYYFFRLDAIVPGIIITATISMLLSRYFFKKIEIENVRVTKVRTIAEGRNMMTMGAMISVSGMITLGSAYILRIFIRNNGGISDVGLYNAGFAIINTYVGLVFTAMATDYYPRLSAVAHSNKLCKQSINQQAEIAVLILAPILILFLVFIKWIIIILYSTKFIAVDGMIKWAALGMLFKAASWSVGFILLAKGASKFFFYNELLGSSYILGLNFAGYYFLGLTGLGISFMIGYLLYLIQIFFFSKKKYEFNFNTSFLRILIIQFILALGCFVLLKILNSPYSYIIGTVFILISGWYSFIELEKRIGLREIFASIKARYIAK